MTKEMLNPVPKTSTVQSFLANLPQRLKMGSCNSGEMTYESLEVWVYNSCNRRPLTQLVKADGRCSPKILEGAAIILFVNCRT